MICTPPHHQCRTHTIKQRNDVSLALFTPLLCSHFLPSLTSHWQAHGRERTHWKRKIATAQSRRKSRKVEKSIVTQKRRKIMRKMWRKKRERIFFRTQNLPVHSHSRFQLKLFDGERVVRKFPFKFFTTSNLHSKVTTLHNFWSGKVVS